MTKKEFDSLANIWSKGNHDTLADSLLYHAKLHGDSNLPRYLRQAAGFSTKGASKTTRLDGSTIYKKNGKYTIYRDGKMVSYGGIND